MNVDLTSKVSLLFSKKFPILKGAIFDYIDEVKSSRKQISRAELLTDFSPACFWYAFTNIKLLPSKILLYSEKNYTKNISCEDSVNFDKK